VGTVEQAAHDFVIRMGSRSTGIPPAAAGSIKVLKRRAWGERGLAAVRGTTADGQALFGVVEFVRRTPADWRVVGGSWGFESMARPGAEPWANFGGEWGPDGCWAAGHVVGAAVHRVRMVDDTGTREDEDTVDEGVALLRLDGPCPGPCTVELYDAAGALLRTQLHAPPEPAPQSPPDRAPK
jgi:hypothetical protein